MSGTARCDPVDSMYCEDCGVVEAVYVDGYGWRCTECEEPAFGSKEAMIEVVHWGARFNKEHGYGPWWDGGDR